MDPRAARFLALAEHVTGSLGADNHQVPADMPVVDRLGREIRLAHFTPDPDDIDPSNEVYVLGHADRADEGLPGEDLRVRPTRLGEGEYTAVVAPDCLFNSDGSPFEWLAAPAPSPR